MPREIYKVCASTPPQKKKTSAEESKRNSRQDKQDELADVSFYENMRLKGPQTFLQ